jgi:hypothetical protein
MIRCLPVGTADIAPVRNEHDMIVRYALSDKFQVHQVWPVPLVTRTRAMHGHGTAKASKLSQPFVLTRLLNNRYEISISTLPQHSQTARTSTAMDCDALLHRRIVVCGLQRVTAQALPGAPVRLNAGALVCCG